MPKGKVEKCTWFSQWEYQNKVNHNFVIKFEGSDDRFVYVGQDKENPKFKEGLELEYKLDGRKIKGNIGAHQFEYEKISPVQAQGGGFGGGGGGGKRYPKSYNEYVNELAWQTQQHTINFFCHRVNLDPIKDFGSYYDVFYKKAFEHLKKD